MDLGRQTFLTGNARCFAVSGLASAGLEAFFNSLLVEHDTVAIGGSPRFVAETASIARRYGAAVIALDDLRQPMKLLVVPQLDPYTGQLWPVADLAEHAHRHGAHLLVDATMSLGAVELRVDDWHVDACIAGADYAVGAPTGMALVTYAPHIEAILNARSIPPTTSYLDLVQLQAYWSPERLNHHTAPTSLVYGLREALRLIHQDGLARRWERHAWLGQALRSDLANLGLPVTGDGPYAIVHLPPDLPEAQMRERLRTDHGVHVQRIAAHTWRLGLLAAHAQPETLRRLINAVTDALRTP